MCIEVESQVHAAQGDLIPKSEDRFEESNYSPATWMKRIRNCRTLIRNLWYEMGVGKCGEWGNAGRKAELHADSNYLKLIVKALKR